MDRYDRTEKNTNTNTNTNNKWINYDTVCYSTVSVFQVLYKQQEEKQAAKQQQQQQQQITIPMLQY